MTVMLVDLHRVVRQQDLMYSTRSSPKSTVLKRTLKDEIGSHRFHRFWLSTLPEFKVAASPKRSGPALGL